MQPSNRPQRTRAKGTAERLYDVYVKLSGRRTFRCQVRGVTRAKAEAETARLVHGRTGARAAFYLPEVR